MFYYYFKSRQKVLLVFCTVFVFAITSVSAQDTLCDLPEFKLPLTNKKLVIAHCMTHIISYKGHPFEDGCNPEYYPITNNISSPIGGLTQVNVMVDRYMKDSSLEAAVEFEMRAAKRCGIDGFQFYYTLGDKFKDEVIEAYFKVAKEKNIDFKFTFCFSHPQVEGKDENMKLVEFASRVKTIMTNVGRDNPHWLRTPDGRLIVYLWYGEQLADIPWENLDGHSPEFYAARAYKKLANAVGEKFACIYSINDKLSNSQIHKILDYFPSIWMWTQSYTFGGLADKIASISKKRDRQFTVSVFSDFYTSKVLRPGTWDMIHQAADAVVAGKNGIERKYVVTGLSETFRNELDFALKIDAPILNIITWNDYPEGHHLAPEVNHNYGFSVLLNYYKNIWEKLPSPYQDRDVAIAFFKKYTSKVKPDPFNIKIETLGKTSKPEFEDSIEIVTILPSPAQLEVNGERVNVGTGLVATRFRSQPGAVKVSIIRDGVVTKSFITPEWITDKPIRTDRITYTFDTEYENFHRDIFGDRPPIYSTQYNDSINNGKSVLR